MDKGNSKSLLIAMLLLFAVSTSAGAYGMGQGLSDPCCYNFTNDPMKQNFEERIREVSAQNWNKAETFGLKGAREFAEDHRLQPMFLRGVNDARDLGSIESTYFNVGGEVLWKEGFPTPVNQDIWTDACITADLDCDDNPDVLVHVRRCDPETGVCTHTVIAKRGKDGTHLWEESVSGKGAYLHAYPVGDLTCDGKADVLVEIYEYNQDTETSRCTVIAKIGKNGTELWRDSVSGKDAYLYAHPVDDLDCDGKTDFLVHKQTCIKGICTQTVIAKIGKNGTELWRKSVIGKDAHLHAYPVPDLDCDKKTDVLVVIYNYNPGTIACTCTIIAKKGKDGTELWEESVTGAGEYSASIYAYPVHDFDCDNKTDVLVVTQTYDQIENMYFYEVIAKRGYDGEHLWEESASGTYAYMDAYPADDFNCDGKTDVMVRIRTRYSPATDVSEWKLIAKSGKTGEHLWEESIIGTSAYLYASQVPDFTCDDKPDFLVYFGRYDPVRDLYTRTVVARKGKDGEHLWKSSVSGTDVGLYAYAVSDLDCDGKADAVVVIRKCDDDGICISTVMARKGKDGALLWDESVTGKDAYLYADPVPDLDCDGKPDFLVHEQRCIRGVCTHTVIAKKGKTGKHLWEESVSCTGWDCSIHAYAVPDLTCDDKADVLVMIHKYDPETDSSKCAVIAKKGKTGEHLWEESISGKYAGMDAYPIHDIDDDKKTDILVSMQTYDPKTDRYHYKVIAKKGLDGTHLIWGESDEWIWVAPPCWWWLEPYLYVDEASARESAASQSTEGIIPVPEALIEPPMIGYDLNCDGMNDLLIGTSNMMYALTAKRIPEGTVYLKPQHSGTHYCNTVEVEIWVNATRFQSGQINLTYDPTCADVTNCVLNKATFPISGWDSSVPGREWITFMATSSLTGEYMVGTLTIHCVCEDECTTALDFVDPSTLFDPYSAEVPANWIDGTFECITGICGDVNCDEKVNMGDVTMLFNNVTYGYPPLCDTWAADVNCDNKINMGDVTLLFNHVTYGYPLKCC